jgi:hypothetical protein
MTGPKPPKNDMVTCDNISQSLTAVFLQKKIRHLSRLETSSSTHAVADAQHLKEPNSFLLHAILVSGAVTAVPAFCTARSLDVLLHYSSENVDRHFGL